MVEMSWQLNEIVYVGVNNSEVASGLAIINSGGNSLQVEVADFDDWFDVLSNGYTSLCQKSPYIGKLASQKDPLHFSCYKNKFRIRFQTQTIEFDDLDEFINSATVSETKLEGMKAFIPIQKFIKKK